MEDKIKEIIEKEFNAKTLEIKRINEGYSHYMYEVKIDKEPFILIIRFSNNKNEESNLGKEKYVMELLEKNKIPAPKIYVYDKEYMIIEKIKGIRLDTLWNSLNKDEKIEITKKMGKLLSQIHSIKLEKFGVIQEGGKIKCDDPFKFRKMGEPIEYNLFLRELFKGGFEDFARLLSYNPPQKSLMIKIFTYLVNNLNKMAYQDPPTLIHGDYFPGHIFVEKENGSYKIVGLIDFEFSNSYAPEFDFIKLHRQGFFEDIKLKAALEEGYGKPIDEKAVEVFRLMRDLGFAWVVLESGNKELSDKTLKDIEKRIDTPSYKSHDFWSSVN